MPAHRLAVLIDGENIQPANWPSIVAAVSQIGRPVIIRAYACHAGPGQSWSNIDGVELIDGRPANTRNAADFLLAMDAVDIAIREDVDSFVIVSGDSDFAAVAHHLRRWTPRVSMLIAPNNHKIPPRLVAAADLAMALPSLAAPVKAVGSPANVYANWKDSVLALMNDIVPDAEGWIDIAVLGTAVKAAGCQVPGKLLKRMRGLPDTEIREAGGRWFIRIRSRNRQSPVPPVAESLPTGPRHSPDQTATAEPHGPAASASAAPE